MREHIDNFKNFSLKENLNQHTIYTENELKRYIKNLYNSSFQSSIKDIELSLSDKFMKIESKYRFKYGGKNKDSHIEIFRDDKSYVYFKDEEKRILKIDGKSTRYSKFFENRSANIFNPEKIELLMISPSQRREFLDDTILKYDFTITNRDSSSSSISQINCIHRNLRR